MTNTQHKLRVYTSVKPRDMLSVLGNKTDFNGFHFAIGKTTQWFDVDATREGLTNFLSHLIVSADRSKKHAAILKLKTPHRYYIKSKEMFASESTGDMFMELGFIDGYELDTKESVFGFRLSDELIDVALRIGKIGTVPKGEAKDSSWEVNTDLYEADTADKPDISETDSETKVKSVPKKHTKKKKNFEIVVVDAEQKKEESEGEELNDAFFSKEEIPPVSEIEVSKEEPSSSETIPIETELTDTSDVSIETCITKEESESEEIDNLSSEALPVSETEVSSENEKVTEDLFLDGIGLFEKKKSEIGGLSEVSKEESNSVKTIPIETELMDNSDVSIETCITKLVSLAKSNEEIMTLLHAIELYAADEPARVIQATNILLGKGFEEKVQPKKTPKQYAEILDSDLIDLITVKDLSTKAKKAQEALNIAEDYLRDYPGAREPSEYISLYRVLVNQVESQNQA